MDILSFVASSLAFGFVIIAVFMAQQTRFKVLVNTVFWFSIACLVGARFYIEADVASPVGLVSRSVSMWEVTKQFVAGTPLTYIRKSYGEQQPHSQHTRLLPKSQSNSRLLPMRLSSVSRSRLMMRRSLPRAARAMLRKGG